jgi:soluble lytic murein transglycosylase-like protein
MLILLLCVLLASGSAQAFCWQQAADRYNLDPLLLWSIAKVESDFRPDALNRNRDGSHDIGLMQINSRNLPKLANFGYTEKVLRENACASVMAGAWILSGLVTRYGYNWHAVGAYNAGTASNRQSARQRYAQKIWQVYRQQLKAG